MKIFSEITLLSFIMIVAASSASAQGEKQKQKVQAEIDKVTTALNLNEQKSEALYEIELASYTKLRAVKKSAKEGTITKEDGKAQVRKIREENDIAIEAALGGELAAQYKAYKEAKKAKGGAGNKNGNKQAAKVKAGIDQIAGTLGLEEGISAKIYEIELDSHTKLKAIKKAAKAGTITKEDGKAQAIQIRQENEAKLKEALGEELSGKYIAARNEQKGQKNKK